MSVQLPYQVGRTIKKRRDIPYRLNDRTNNDEQLHHTIKCPKIMYFPERGCVRPLCHLYGYATARRLSTTQQRRTFTLTRGNDSEPVQLAQCWFPGLAVSSAKIQTYFKIKCTQAILSNSTRKLSWLEISKKLIAGVNNEIYCVIYYNFRHTLVPF